jgi:hypothetical protein
VSRSGEDVSGALRQKRRGRFEERVDETLHAGAVVVGTIQADRAAEVQRELEVQRPVGVDLDAQQPGVAAVVEQVGVVLAGWLGEAVTAGEGEGAYLGGGGGTR